LLIYEVHNTFGDIHSYVLPVRPSEISDAGIRQTQDKLFYVSPFIGMAPLRIPHSIPAWRTANATLILTPHHPGRRRGK
jgi:DUF1365 family protein